MKFSSSSSPSLRTLEAERRISVWAALDFGLHFLLCAGVVVGTLFTLGWVLLLCFPQLNVQAAWLAARMSG